jgi:hypothetical protein
MRRPSGRFAGRLPALTGALALGLGVLLAPGSEAAPTSSIGYAPAGVRPGHSVTISGQAPHCKASPIAIIQHYLATNGNRTMKPGVGGTTDGEGKFSFSLQVPRNAVYSAITRAFAGYQYDDVEVRFASCGTVLGVGVLVKPFNYREHITWSPTRPRTGTTLHVTATHCAGGVVPNPFAEVIDRAGSYYPLTGTTTNGTFHGTVDLRHGLAGVNAPRGWAKPSAPGKKDAVLMVPCAQSTGPRSVAEADKIMHLRWAVDIHIRHH